LAPLGLPALLDAPRGPGSHFAAIVRVEQGGPAIPKENAVMLNRSVNEERTAKLSGYAASRAQPARLHGCELALALPGLGSRGTVG
jgi:hypothetical protein